jgi:predicted small lipoprotein YifL
MVWQRGFSMKKIAIALIACITAASLAGCVGKGPWVGKGKGKTPPPAVVTKG